MNECEDYNSIFAISTTILRDENPQKTAAFLIEDWKRFNPNYGVLNVYRCDNPEHGRPRAFICNPQMGAEPSLCRCGRMSTIRITP